MVPRSIHILQAHPKGSIRAMYFDIGRNYLITGNHEDGVIAIHDLDKPGKVYFLLLYTQLIKYRKSMLII